MAGENIQPPEVITKEWWESDFTLDPNVLDGYPSFAELGNFNDNELDSKYNFSSKYNDLEGYPSLRLGPIRDNKMNSNYTFGLDGDYLNGYPFLKQKYVNIVDDFLVYSKYVFAHQDEPNYIDGYPTLGQQELQQFGVGRDSTIDELEIPYSVTFIADYAFYDAPINSVKINRHCTYFRHSFPPGCHIKPYKDEE